MVQCNKQLKRRAAKTKVGLGRLRAHKGRHSVNVAHGRLQQHSVQSSTAVWMGSYASLEERSWGLASEAVDTATYL